MVLGVGVKRSTGVPLCNVNCCSATFVTRPRTLAAGGCLSVARTDRPMNASAIEKPGSRRCWLRGCVGDAFLDCGRNLLFHAAEGA